MELNFNDFDEDSKKTIKELASDGEKFTNLINKLQVAKNSVNKSIEFEQALKEEIKK